MRVLQMAAKSDSIGVVHLELPLGTANEEFELAIVVSPKAASAKPKTPEELGWPPGFSRKPSDRSTMRLFVNLPIQFLAQWSPSIEIPSGYKCMCHIFTREEYGTHATIWTASLV